MKKLILTFSLVVFFIFLIIPCNVSGKQKDLNIDLPKLYLNGDVNKLKSKNEEIVIEVKYVDEDINFEGFAKIKWQGSSSINYEKKNYTIKFYKDSELKDKLKVDFGWGKENKYCLKANWVDKTHSRNIVSAKLVGKIQDKYNLLNDLPNNGSIDGFPIEVYLNNEFLGLYTLNIPKDAWMYNMDEDNENNLVVVGDANNDDVLFKNEFTEFNSFELEVGNSNQSTIDKFARLVNFIKNSTDEEFRNNINDYFNLDSLLNYYVFMQFAQLYDNQGKNLVLATYDGSVWYTLLYDLDTSWGTHWMGTTTYDYSIPIESDSILWSKFKNNFNNEIADRYFELRKDILTKESVLKLFKSFYNSIPDEAFEKEANKWKNIPGYDLSQIEDFLEVRIPILDEYFTKFYTYDGVAGVCNKNEDGSVTVNLVNVYENIIVESDVTYTFEKDGEYTFLYSDFLGNKYFLTTDVSGVKFNFDR